MLSETEMHALLKSAITENRYSHTLGVVEAAVRLAGIHGADTEKCRIAALLHDCAKSMSKADMLKAIKNGGIELYPGEEDVEPVLHAPAGKALAQSVYGVEDAEILSAIRKHTLGGDGMSLLETIIYVADFIEPGRKPFEGLEKVRQLAETDINAAADACARLTSEYCKSNGKAVFVPV